MVDGGFGQGRVFQFGQLLEGGLGVGFAELGGFAELVRQVPVEAPVLQAADGCQLLLGRVHSLAQVGGLAVDPAVDSVAQILLHLGLHDPHGADRRAQRCQKILNLVALLEIEHVAPGPADGFRGEAHLLHQPPDLPAHPQMGRDQLQMIALLRVRHRAPGHKGPPEKRRPAALLFENAQIDLEGHGGGGLQAEDIVNPVDLFRVLHGENLLARPVLRQLVELEAEGLLEQLRQPLGKIPALGDDPDCVGRKRIAEQQHAVALRHGAAGPGGRQLAQLLLDAGTKGHLSHPLYLSFRWR